jgi:hypothetical protein
MLTKPEYAQSLSALSPVEQEAIKSGTANNALVSKWLNGAKQARVTQPATLDADKLKRIDGTKNKIVIRGVSENEISEAQSAFANMGISVKFKNPRDVKRTIDGNQIRHTLKQHGDPKIEAARGNIAITYNDVADYTRIIDNHDLKSFGVSANRLPAIRYGKQINGYYIVVEEVRNKSHNFAFHTMYKRKGKLTQESLMLSKEKQEARGLPSSLRPETTALLGRRDNANPLETIQPTAPKSQAAETTTQTVERVNNETKHIPANCREYVRKASIRNETKAEAALNAACALASFSLSESQGIGSSLTLNIRPLNILL